jgi:hypothetical protein
MTMLGPNGHSCDLKRSRMANIIPMQAFFRLHLALAGCNPRVDVGIFGPDHSAGVERITRVEFEFQEEAENQTPWD